MSDGLSRREMLAAGGSVAALAIGASTVMGQEEPEPKGGTSGNGDHSYSEGFELTGDNTVPIPKAFIGFMFAYTTDQPKNCTAIFIVSTTPDGKVVDESNRIARYPNNDRDWDPKIDQDQTAGRLLIKTGNNSHAARIVFQGLRM